MLEDYSGATRIYFIVGHPIAQVKAPYGLTKALQEVGVDGIVVPIDVLPENLSEFLNAAAKLRNCDGICVTVPHKFGVVPHCATVSDTTKLLGSANMMRRNADGTWHGDMFDGPGHVGAMKNGGAKLEGARSLLIGAGGAGSAIGLAILDAGARELAIHDEDATRRDTLIAKLSTAHPGKVVVGSADPTGFDTVSNATPAGMREGDALPVDVSKLTAATFVSEVVTKPAVTPLLEEARRIGCRTSTGIDMFQAETSLMRDFWVENVKR